MEKLAFAGTLLRMLRLEKNWSQETLSQGICAVSYLSKIEQGRAEANENLIQDLFARLGYAWDLKESTKMDRLCEEAYEAVFSGNPKVTRDCKKAITEKWNRENIGPWYLDLAILHAYCTNSVSVVPEQMVTFLNDRQSCLYYLLKNAPAEAYRRYPCALSCLATAENLYRQGKYAESISYLQRSYAMASDSGYVSLMLYCQAYLSNCYSDMQNLEKMLYHNRIAKRIAEASGDTEIVKTLAYNIAATQIECGDVESAYAFFAETDTNDPMYLHKYAICCEKLGNREEALKIISLAETKDPLDTAMCDLVRYRLKNPGYLKEESYGKLLLDTFHKLRSERSVGFARFHLPWVEEWCTANRQYRFIYEILKDFSRS